MPFVEATLSAPLGHRKSPRPPPDIARPCPGLVSGKSKARKGLQKGRQYYRTEDRTAHHMIPSIVGVKSDQTGQRAAEHRNYQQASEGAE